MRIIKKTKKHSKILSAHEETGQTAATSAVVPLLNSSNSFLRISNIESAKNSFFVKLYSPKGKLLFSKEISLKSNASTDIQINSISKNQTGLLFIESALDKKFIASTINYNANKQTGVLSIYSMPGFSKKENATTNVGAFYNRFLAQECKLLFINSNLQPERVDIEINFQRKTIFSGNGYLIPPRGTVSVDIYSLEDKNIYGIIKARLPSTGIYALLIRKGEDYLIPTQMFMYVLNE